MEFITELESNIKSLLTELEVDVNEVNHNDYMSKFKKVAFQLCLKRYLTVIKAMLKLESRLEENIDNIEDINELMTVYKSLVKGVDALNSQLRFLMPSEVQETNNEFIEQEVNNILSDISDGDKFNYQKLVINNIKELIKMIARVKDNMNKFDTGSIDYWKAQNSYLELTSKLLDYVKLLDKIMEEEYVDNEELTVEDIMNIYNQIKILEQEDGEV